MRTLDGTYWTINTMIEHVGHIDELDTKTTQWMLNLVLEHLEKCKSFIKDYEKLQSDYSELKFRYDRLKQELKHNEFKLSE